MYNSCVWRSWFIYLPYAVTWVKVAWTSALLVIEKSSYKAEKSSSCKVIKKCTAQWHMWAMLINNLSDCPRDRFDWNSKNEFQALLSALKYCTEAVLRQLTFVLAVLCSFCSCLQMLRWHAQWTKHHAPDTDCCAPLGQCPPVRKTDQETPAHPHQEKGLCKGKKGGSRSGGSKRGERPHLQIKQEYRLLNINILKVAYLGIEYHIHNDVVCSPELRLLWARQGICQKADWYRL